MINAEFSPLFTGTNCAYILSTAAVKLNFENFNDAIRAYRKYFRKSCYSLIDAELRSLFTGADCTLILLIVAEKSNFEFFMTSFAHTGSTFEKVAFKRNVWNLILYFLPQTVHRYHEQFLGYLHLKEFMTSFL